MPSPDWEDLAEFFDPDEFADAAILKREGEELGGVLGVFEHPTEPAGLGDYKLDHTGPRFTCPAQGVALMAARGDELEVDGETYDVLEPPEQDGTGLVALILAEKAGEHAGF